MLPSVRCLLVAGTIANNECEYVSATTSPTSDDKLQKSLLKIRHDSVYFHFVDKQLFVSANVFHNGTVD